jgi:mevalonate kinase
LTPAASVGVAQIQATFRSRNADSTTERCPDRSPAWWNATPARRQSASCCPVSVPSTSVASAAASAAASSIPSASARPSSASRSARSTASRPTIDAAARELGVELTPVEIADRAYQVEHTVQDGEASRADTFCSAMGGAVRVEGDDCRTIDAPDLPFVIGYDGGAGDTGALVAGVRRLREDYDFAADTVSAIGDIVRRGEEALVDGDIDELGRLMNFNHGLLEALGVSSRSLDAMVWAARDAGALGAKLTGAGGGGCIVALDETPETTTALEYTPGCEQAFRAELDSQGVRVEEQ